MDDQTPQPLSGCFLRLSWLLLGPALLLVSGILVLAEGHGWFGPLDAVYAAILGASLFARVLDRSPDPPARGKYTTGLTTAALVIWVAAHLARGLM